MDGLWVSRMVFHHLEVRSGVDSHKVGVVFHHLKEGWTLMDGLWVSRMVFHHLEVRSGVDSHRWTLSEQGTFSPLRRGVDSQ